MTQKWTLFMSIFVFILHKYPLTWDSSIHTVSDYRLDDRGSIPAEEKIISSSLFVQIISEFHTASDTMGTVVPFPGSKSRPGHDPNHSPHLALRSKMIRSFFLLSPYRLHGGSGKLYFTNIRLLFLNALLANLTVLRSFSQTRPVNTLLIFQNMCN
jgi:hypothetical protein